MKNFAVGFFSGLGSLMLAALVILSLGSPSPSDDPAPALTSSLLQIEAYEQQIDGDLRVLAATKLMSDMGGFDAFWEGFDQELAAMGVAPATFNRNRINRLIAAKLVDFGITPEEMQSEEVGNIYLERRLTTAMDQAIDFVIPLVALDLGR